MSIIDAKLNKRDNVKYYDFSFDSNGQFEIDESFDTSLVMSIGVDARATDQEIIHKELQRGNLINLFNGINNGSKLWLLNQARSNNETRNRAIDYMKKCLQWLIDDGFLGDVIVNGELKVNGLLLNVVLKRKDGAFDNFAYQAWNNSIYKVA